MLDQHFDVRPIDVLSREMLADDIAVIAQPRRLTPQELVALDKWVRRGGRAMIFADPELVWPSDYPLGDSRRAPPVTLLDPLLTHWGVALGDSNHRVQDVVIDGMRMVFRAAGTWSGPKECSGTGSNVLECPIGKGRVVMIGDADVLDPRLWNARGIDNPAWLIQRIVELEGTKHRSSTRLSASAIAGIMFGTSTVLVLLYWRFRRT